MLADSLLRWFSINPTLIGFFCLLNALSTPNATFLTIQIQFLYFHAWTVRSVCVIGTNEFIACDLPVLNVRLALV